LNIEKVMVLRPGNRNKKKGRYEEEDYTHWHYLIKTGINPDKITGKEGNLMTVGSS